MNMKLNINKLIRAVVTPIVNLFLRHKKVGAMGKKKALKVQTTPKNIDSQKRREL